MGLLRAGDCCRLGGEELEGGYLACGLTEPRAAWPGGGEERESLPCRVAGGRRGLLRWRGGGEAEDGGLRLFTGLPPPRLRLGEREARRLEGGEVEGRLFWVGRGEGL